MSKLKQVIYNIKICRLPYFSKTKEQYSANSVLPLVGRLNQWDHLILAKTQER